MLDFIHLLMLQRRLRHWIAGFLIGNGISFGERMIMTIEQRYQVIETETGALDRSVVVDGIRID
jgi:hypothetical protein